METGVNGVVTVAAAQHVQEENQDVDLATIHRHHVGEATVPGLLMKVHHVQYHVSISCK